MKKTLRAWLWRTWPSLFHYLTKGQDAVFSIGIYTGDSPTRLRPFPEISNPVLSKDDVFDRPADYVADPFMCQVDGRWHMFFEVMCKLDNKGVIASANSDDCLTWHYNRTVLSEPFHLAYPYIFFWGENTYMVPDSGGYGVRLYEAIDFPNEWRYVDTILNGARYVDSTLFEYQQRWWMFSAASPTKTAHKSLYLFYADSPMGPWVAHPANPIVSNCNRISRPGGRVVVVRDRLFRFAQDGFPNYGTQVRAFEILDMTTNSYVEREIDSGPVLAAGDLHWNSAGMHHIDAHRIGDEQWLACVDGWFDRTSL